MTQCRHANCTRSAQRRFTIRLRGGYVIEYCDEHFKAWLDDKAGAVQAIAPVPPVGGDDDGEVENFALGVGSD